MRVLKCLLLGLLVLTSCKEKKVDENVVLFGMENEYTLSKGDKHIAKIDSLHVLANDRIHGEGVVQFPINRVIESDSFDLFIDVVIPGKDLKLVIDQTEGTNDVLLKKDCSFFIKSDSLYVFRRFIKDPNDETFVYEFNYFSQDSISILNMYTQDTMFVEHKINWR